MTRFAELWLREKPGTDTALFSAMAHVIVAEKLHDAAFVAARTEGFEEYVASLAEKTPEWSAAITGVPAEDIRRAARIYAGAQAAAMYWGMGISQSTHGTDNTLTLTNLALLCGHIGRPGTGLNPLRGQNNVQGCSDMGGVPSFYTAYQPITDPAVRAAFEAAWGVPLPAEPGLTATEMVDGILSGQVKGWYVMGENPLMSEPNLAHARHAVEHLEFFVAQDIFFNETNVYADVILPAASFAEKDGTFTNSDRRVQRVRRALPPPGLARADSFAPEEASPTHWGNAAPWKILIVDDEPTVHDVTRLALTNFEFDGRPLNFLHAYTADEAARLFGEHPDIALAMVDVVMESEHAGLDLVKRIREEFKNSLVRIVLRTGQPGQAPERTVIRDYDINDYKEKTELSAHKLYSAVFTSLRSYRDLAALDANRRGLERVIRASGEVFRHSALSNFIQGVLEQLIALLYLDTDSMYVNCDSLALEQDPEHMLILAATGQFAPLVGQEARTALAPEVFGPFPRRSAAARPSPTKACMSAISRPA